MPEPTRADRWHARGERLVGLVLLLLVLAWLVAGTIGRVHEVNRVPAHPASAPAPTHGAVVHLVGVPGSAP